MSLIHDYLQLCHALAVKHQQEYCIPVTLSDVSKILCCTVRNARIILGKMCDKQWIEFIPGRGRGHYSKIIFKLDYEQTLSGEAKRLVQSGEVEAAFHLIKRYGADTAFGQNEFVSWLSGYFGYSVDRSHERYIETVRLPVYRTINTLDPADAFYGLDMQLVSQIFDTLVGYNRQIERFEGRIAHHWKHNQQGTEWTFYLRKGVYFHNGRELDAEDVRFSLLRLSNPMFGQSWLAEGIVSILILSKYALRIILQKPNHRFLEYLSYPPMSIVSRTENSSIKTVKEGAIAGTGAYRVAERSSEICVLEAFEQHFNGRAFIDRVEILVIPEHTLPEEPPRSEDLLIHTDECNLNSLVTADHWEHNVQITGCTLLTLNQSKAGSRLSNPDFRRALQHMINRSQMVQELGGSRLRPAQGLMMKEQDEAADPLYNPELASLYMCNVPKPSEPLRLFTYQRHASDACWLAEEFSKFGVGVEVRIVSWGDMLLKENIEQADMILFEMIHNEGLIRLIESCKAYFIRSHLESKLAAQIDILLDELVSKPDRHSLDFSLKEIEQALNKETALIYLVHKTMNSSSSPMMMNVELNDRGWVDFKKIWFDPESTDKDTALIL